MTRPIALIGLSGSGKSTVSAIAAEILGWLSADSDRVIENETGRTIPDIFTSDGEAAFRQLEAAAITALLRDPKLVLSTGGGAPTTCQGQTALRGAFVVWLRIRPETAAQRLDSDPGTEKRPLLAGGTFARLSKLDELRRNMYETSADVIIDVDGLTPSQVADAVISAWRSRKGQPIGSVEE